MSSSGETIAAISTPLGVGGIGIVRLSGEEAHQIAHKIFVPKNPEDLSWDRTLILGSVVEPDSGEPVDEALLCLMKAPRTYTKEDVAEINCHGGIFSVAKTLDLVVKAGACIAEPGEFTKRAFLNGRIDLSQAEAVAELINAKSEASMKVALNRMRGLLSNKVRELLAEVTVLRAEQEAVLDFEEEDLEIEDETSFLARLGSVRQGLEQLLETSKRGRPLRDGVTAVIVGSPNVGKSSLLNALLMRERAIVTAIPGTTRDLIEESFSVKGLGFCLLDTAGIREPKDEIERIGIARSREAAECADLIIVVLDSSKVFSKEDEKILSELDGSKSIFALNKCDLRLKIRDKDLIGRGITKWSRLSALTGEGLEEFCESLYLRAIGSGLTMSDEALVCGARQTASLERALLSIKRGEEALAESRGAEIVAEELKSGGEFLGEMIGMDANELLVDEVFSKFCIGK